MKWSAKSSDERKAISVHDIGVEIEACDETTERKTNDAEGYNAACTAVFRYEELLGNTKFGGDELRSETKQQRPKYQEQVIFLDMKH
jgi:hypothetical protein